MRNAQSNVCESPRDIETEADVRDVVNAFYSGIEKDPVIGGYFADLDMENHLPRMYGFWTSVVFQSGAYRGRPFDAHMQLNGLAAAHFSRWLQRFESTIDQAFVGERADQMKEKAHQIGTIFQIKLGLETSP